MQRELEGTDDRRIRVHTIYGSLEGLLRTSAGVSTMHYLNVVSTTQKCLTLRPPLACSHDWLFEGGSPAIATDSILFVVELSEFEPRPGDPHEAAQFQRAAVRLLLADFIIDGYVHVPPGGNPIYRVIQDPHPFIAMTSVSVIGPDEQFTAPFMAARHSHIVAVQEIAQGAESPEELHAVDHAAR